MMHEFTLTGLVGRFPSPRSSRPWSRWPEETGTKTAHNSARIMTRTSKGMTIAFLPIADRRAADG